MNEDALIAGCAKHDKSAQRSVYDLYFNEMANLVDRYSKNQEETKAIVLSGFKNFFNQFGQFTEARAKKNKENLTLAGWLKEKMIEAAITHLHRNKKEYFVSSTVSVRDENKQAEREFTDEYLRSILNQKILLSAMENLTPSYRAVFNLHEVDGYSHAQISKLLDISEYSSKDMLQKAKFNLRKNIIELIPAP